MRLLLILCFLSFAAAQDMVAADTVEALVSQEQGFGTLNIMPAYLNSNRKGEAWDLTIGNENYFLFKTKIRGTNFFETKLMANKYKVKLANECYEDINFEIDIKKDDSINFDIRNYVKPKMGTLILNAQRKGISVIEPVFVDNELVGETPFKKEIPICSDVKISIYKNQIYAMPESGKEKEHTHIMNPPHFFAWYLHFSMPSIANSYYHSYDYSNLSYTEKKHNLLGLNFMIGLDFIDFMDPLYAPSLGFFMGGGILDHDSAYIGDFERIGEFAWGLDVKTAFRPFKRIIVPIALALAHRIQWTDMDNRLIASFIDSPKFLHEPEYYFYRTRTIYRHSFELVPSIDLQYLFDGGNYSLYMGYMYHISFSDDWKFVYFDKKDKTFTVPKEYNPLKNGKESFFGMPGALRVGIKFYGRNYYK